MATTAWKYALIEATDCIDHVIDYYDHAPSAEAECLTRQSRTGRFYSWRETTPAERAGAAARTITEAQAKAAAPRAWEA